jgi:hypothetical protein
MNSSAVEPESVGCPGDWTATKGDACGRCCASRANHWVAPKLTSKERASYVAGDAGVARRSIPGVFGSLSKKGLILTKRCAPGGDMPAGNDTVWLTDAGVVAAKAEIASKKAVTT